MSAAAPAGILAEAAGAEPIFQEWGGHDPIGYVVSLNIRRRHLSLSQKEELLRKLRNTVWPKMAQGGQTKVTNGTSVPSNAKVAKALGVSKRTVKRWDAKREGRVREPDPEPDPEPEPEPERRRP